MTRKDQQLGVSGVVAEADLEHPEGHQGIGSVGGGPGQQIDAREEAPGERQEVGGLGVGLRRRRDQRAQLGVVAGVAAHLRRALGRLADETGPQVRARHADHRPLELLAVGDHQIAERPSAGLVADRPPERGREPLLSIEVDAVEALDHRRGGPVTERALERVGGVAWRGACPALRPGSPPGSSAAPDRSGRRIPAPRGRAWPGRPAPASPAGRRRGARRWPPPAPPPDEGAAAPRARSVIGWLQSSAGSNSARASRNDSKTTSYTSSFSRSRTSRRSAAGWSAITGSSR